MKLQVQIVGDGSFGTCLKEHLLNTGMCDIVDDAPVVILAVPISAYEEVASKHRGKTLVNVCSVQSEANDILDKHSDSIVGIHPLFGARTPKDADLNSILTRRTGSVTSLEVVGLFSMISDIHTMSADEHDRLMAKTHGASVKFAVAAKTVIDEVGVVPDHMVPNSFKLLKKFVKTLEDMPQGTMESILSNPYIEQD
jgi:prephenate dehydrogenase